MVGCENEGKKGETDAGWFVGWKRRLVGGQGGGRGVTTGGRTERREGLKRERGTDRERDGRMERPTNGGRTERQTEGGRGRKVGWLVLEVQREEGREEGREEKKEERKGERAEGR